MSDIDQMETNLLYNKIVEMAMDPSIEKIEKGFEEFNFFDVMGIARAEIRHSNALAWLLNPNASHGMGAGLLRFMARKAYYYNNFLDAATILQENYQTLVIRREWRRIDIVAEGEKLVFAIENKVDSGEHGSQLKDYYNELREGKKLPLFFLLSPDGRGAEDEEDQDIWIPISYGELYDAIKSVFDTNAVGQNEKVFITSYLNLLRREFMETKTEKEQAMEEIARQFYENHKEALEYLISLIPDDIATVTDAIRRWLKAFSEKEENKDLGIKLREKETKGFVRFTTTRMDELIGSTGFTPPSDFKGGWSDGSMYYFEIIIYKNRDDEIMIGMQLEFSSGKDKTVRNHLNSIGREINDKRNFDEKWEWKIVWALSDRKGNATSSKKLRYASINAFQDDEEKYDQVLGGGIKTLLKETQGRLKQDRQV